MDEFDNRPETINEACRFSIRRQIAVWYRIYGAYCPPETVIRNNYYDHPGIEEFKRCVNERNKDVQYVLVGMEQYQAWRLLQLICAELQSSCVSGFDELTSKACLDIVNSLGHGESCRWATTILKKRRKYFLLRYTLPTLKTWLLSDLPTLQNILNPLIATGIIIRHTKKHSLVAVIETFAHLYSNNDPEVMAASNVEMLESVLERQLVSKPKRKRTTFIPMEYTTNSLGEATPKRSCNPLVDFIDQRADVFLKGFESVLEDAGVPVDVRPKLAYMLLLNARQTAAS